MKEIIICLVCAIVLIVVCYLIGWAEIELFYHPTGVNAPVMSGCLTYGMATVFMLSFAAWLVIDMSKNK